jgi:hypothetical protein
MTAAFRAKTKMCPVLDTAYIQNPRVDRALVKYTVGYGWKNPICECKPGAVIVTFIVRGMGDVITHTGSFLPTQSIISPWEIFSEEAHVLDGNVTDRSPKLSGLTHTETKTFYPYGSDLPVSGGTFTPTLSYK